ncbi:hypothetical protein D3C75_1237150 [compost metagenome]
MNLQREGNFAASPIMIASPVLKIGNESISELSPSDIAAFTFERSLAFVNLRANNVPHCDNMVSSTSEGLWLIIIKPTPNFLPSLAIR